MRRARRRAARSLSLLLGILLCAQLFSVPTAARIIYQSAAKEGKPRIALTFDDGPHPRYTEMVLDILSEYGVPATFFVVGVNAETYPRLVERAVREGHEIGNHTYNHYHVAKLSDDALGEDIAACSGAIARITGSAPRLLRPPEGVCSEGLTRYCEENGMTVVMWSVDTRDWAHTPVPDMIKNIRCNVKNGSIILMHDFIGKNSPTPKALQSVIPMLLEMGYEFVTVSRLLEG